MDVVMRHSDGRAAQEPKPIRRSDDIVQKFKPFPIKRYWDSYDRSPPTELSYIFPDWAFAGMTAVPGLSKRYSGQTLLSYPAWLSRQKSGIILPSLEHPDKKS